MLNKIATFFSVVFQPIIMPVVTLFVLFYFNEQVSIQHDSELKLKTIGLCALFTILFPLVVFFIFYKLGLVTDVNLTKRKERVVPFFISILLFIIFYYWVRINLDIANPIKSVVFGSLIATIISNIITIWWKISIHSLGVAALFGAVLGLHYLNGSTNLFFLIFALLIAFIVPISRVILKRHTVMQVICGGVLGFACTFFFILYDIQL